MLSAGGCGGVGDSAGRSISAGDASRVDTGQIRRRHLHVHVDAVHRGLSHRIRHADHRRAGIQVCDQLPTSAVNVALPAFAAARRAAAPC